MKQTNPFVTLFLVGLLVFFSHAHYSRAKQLPLSAETARNADDILSDTEPVSGEEYPIMTDMDTDDFSVAESIDANAFSVSPTGKYVSQVITGTGGYFGETHNLLICTSPTASGMAAYCIEPREPAPSSGTCYAETSMNSTVSSTLEQKAGAAAVMMYGYGGQSGINNQILGLPEATGSMGGSYGTYVIDGTAYSGLLINGIFFRMNGDEAQAVTAAVIHKLNGANVGNITGSLQENGESVTAAADYLYNLGYYAKINTAGNGWEHTNFLLYEYTQPRRSLNIQIQGQDGCWSDIPADMTNFDWMPYVVDNKINIRVTYTASKCESKLLKSESVSGTDGTISYAHTDLTTFPDAGAGCDGYYDYFRITAGSGSTVPVHVNYGRLETEAMTTLKLGVIDPAYGGFPPREGVLFRQSAYLSLNADDIAAGGTLDLNIYVPEAAGHTPYYGDGDGISGNYAAGRFFFADGYQDVVVASPNLHFSSFNNTIYIKGEVGQLNIHKASSNKAVTQGNHCYMLSDAVYHVYQSHEDAVSGKNPYRQMTTDSDNFATAGELPFGTYYVKETKAPKGYLLNDTIYPVQIDSTTPVRLDVEDEPCGDMAKIILYKRNTDNIPLKNALFTVKYYDTQADAASALSGQTPKKIWHFKSDENGCVFLNSSCLTGGDDLYYTSDNEPFIPIGTITVQETQAPEGYITDTEIRTFLIGNNQNKDISYENERILTNRKISQAFQLIKYGETENQSANPLAHAGFQACRTDMLSVDANGSYIWDEEKAVSLTPDGSTEMFTDENGYACSIPLSYGTYIVRETTVPKNFLPIEDFIVDIREHSDTPQTMRYFTDESFKAYLKIIKCDKYTGARIIGNPATFRLWSYENEDYVTFEWQDEEGSHMTDEIRTNADGELITPAPLFPGKYKICEITAPNGYYGENKENGYCFEISDSGIYESNSYEDEGTGNTVIFTCILNNAPLTGQIALYKTGEQQLWNTDVPAASQTDGSFDITELPLSDMDYDIIEIPLSGVSFDIIANETIYTPDGQQTVLYEKGTVVETIVTNKEGYASSSDMLPLGEYILRENTPKGYLPAQDIEIELSADATVLEQEGNDILKKHVVQTFNLHNSLILPDLSTTARDSATNSHTGSAAENACIIDTISYTNLIPNEEYMIRGVLIDKSSQNPCNIGGQAITAETSFIPETSDGTVDISFKLDASPLEGKSIVLYETLYQGNEIKAIHADINNADQTITYPTPPETPKTGDAIPYISIILLASISLVSLISIILVKRRKRK